MIVLVVLEVAVVIVVWCGGVKNGGGELITRLFFCDIAKHMLK